MSGVALFDAAVVFERRCWRWSSRRGGGPMCDAARAGSGGVAIKCRIRQCGSVIRCCSGVAPHGDAVVLRVRSGDD